MAAITRRAYARIGLLGNPSGARAALCASVVGDDLTLRATPPADGYNGKTIAVSLENYYAEARRCLAGRRGLAAAAACVRAHFAHPLHR
jgi:hypothetical protein